MYTALKKELRQYFGENGGQRTNDPHRLERLKINRERMEAYAAEHPDASAYELRRKTYELSAKDFRALLFHHSPFYHDLGGNGGWNFSNIGRWLLKHNDVLIEDHDLDIKKRFRAQRKLDLYLCDTIYCDSAHDNVPTLNLIRNGLRFYYEKAKAILPDCTSETEQEFIKTAICGFEAVRSILRQTAEQAKARISTTNDSKEIKNLQRIADTAVRIPWEPPKTFYEGLSTIGFAREIFGEMDGMATNSWGRPDCYLIDLYRADLEAGRLTEADAYDLICCFMLHADMLYDQEKTVSSYGDHEMETGLTIGGCDAQGKPVFNELTRLFLKAYRDLGAIYPKFHCRFSADSPQEYLQLIADDIASGHAAYTLVNDDSLIPALIRDGKTLEDARNYCCTGCWDIVVDSCDNNFGGNYFNLIRVLEATVYDHDELLKEAGLTYQKIDDAADFDTVYQRIMHNTLITMRDMMTIEACGWLRSIAAPTPFYSACMSDCLENRRDYTAGGNRYNPHTVSLCFLANFVDSLLAINDLCFVRKICTVKELLDAVRANWKDRETLRQEVLKAPHWGDGKPETMSLARKIVDYLYANTRDLKNENGGSYQFGCWVYREFRYWGEQMLATPDGRHNGDILSQSLNPSHFRNKESITTVLQCLACLDFTQFAGNSVVNLVLDNSILQPDTIPALIRTFGALKLQLLQLNCTSHEDLLEAQKHPEKYDHLLVRLCGFSAKFTSLNNEWQNEVINRKSY